MRARLASLASARLARVLPTLDALIEPYAQKYPITFFLLNSPMLNAKKLHVWWNVKIIQSTTQSLNKVTPAIFFLSLNRGKSNSRPLTNIIWLHHYWYYITILLYYHFLYCYIILIYYYIIILLYYYIIILSYYYIIILLYYIIISLYYYIIILLYYYNIILLYYYIIILLYDIILTYYTIYWPFSNHGFCSNLASYQWSWIFEDCSRHRISVHVFSMFKKTTNFKSFFVFLGPGSLGPGPMVPPGPMGPPISRLFDFL